MKKIRNISFFKKGGSLCKVLFLITILIYPLMNALGHSGIRNETELFQQDLKVTGTVLDAGNVPMPGVNILVKGTFRGATTGTPSRVQADTGPQKGDNA